MFSNISFDKAFTNVQYFNEKTKSGKKRIETVNTGYTCYANSLKVLKTYIDMKVHVPTKAEKAEKLLEEVMDQ